MSGKSVGELPAESQILRSLRCAPIAQDDRQIQVKNTNGVDRRFRPPRLFANSTSAANSSAAAYFLSSTSTYSASITPSSFFCSPGSAGPVCVPSPEGGACEAAWALAL